MKRWTVLIAALVIWTLLSFTRTFSDSPVCKILQTVPSAGSLATLRPLTQAEMDAQTASCQAPRTIELLVVGAGYLVIVVAGLYVRARGAR
jgi:hypothetical protein